MVSYDDDFADYDDGAKALEKCWLHSWQRKPESEGEVTTRLLHDDDDND